MAEELITTGAALEIAGCDRQVYRTAMDRGALLAAAPPRARHNNRTWDRDSIVVLRFFAQLRDRGTGAHAAGELAALLLEAMKIWPSAQSLAVWEWRRPGGGTDVTIAAEAPRPGATVMMSLPVARYRQEVEELIRQHLSDFPARVLRVAAGSARDRQPSSKRPAGKSTAPRKGGQTRNLQKSARQRQAERQKSK